MTANKRQQKAIQIVQTQSIRRMNSSTYRVRSQSIMNRFYHVRIDESGSFSCECADFAFRSSMKCKHILSVMAYRRLTLNRATQKATIGTERPPSCPRCGFWRIYGAGVKNVKQGLKQRWICGRCSYKFVSSNPIIQKSINVHNGSNLRMDGC